MVYVDPKNLGYEPYWKRWIKSRPEYEIEQLQLLYDRYIPPCIEFIIDGTDGTQQGTPLKTIIFQSNLNMVSQFCNIFDARFPQLESGEEYEADIIECGFITVKK